VESGRAPAPPAPLDEPLRTLDAYLRQLEAARAAELAARRVNTPTLEAVFDFTRVIMELNRIAREVTGMQLALEGG
jgi:hypothetical protein